MSEGSAVDRAEKELRAARSLFDGLRPVISGAALHVVRGRWFLASPETEIVPPTFDDMLAAVPADEAASFRALAPLFDDEPDEELCARELAALTRRIHAARGLTLASRFARAKRPVAAVFVLAVVLVVGGRLAGAREERTHPWTALYFDSPDFTGPATETTAPFIDEDWRNAGPPFMLREDHFSVKWASCLVLEEATNVTFIVDADDRGTLSVDGEIVVTAVVGEVGTAKVLSAGTHHIDVSLAEEVGTANIRVKVGLGLRGAIVADKSIMSRCKDR